MTRARTGAAATWLALAGLAGCAPQPAKWCPLPPIAPTPARTLVFGWLVPPAPVFQPTPVPRELLDLLFHPTCHPAPAPPPAAIPWTPEPVPRLCIKRWAIRSALKPLEACEDLQRRRAPKAHGSLTIDVWVGADGKVRRAELGPSIPLSADVLGCFARVVLTLPALPMESAGEVPPDALVQGHFYFAFYEPPPSGHFSGHFSNLANSSCWYPPPRK